MVDFIILMLIVAVFGFLLIRLVIAAVDDNRFAQVAFCALVCALIAASIIENKEAEEIGPCIKYEESFMMVGKVMTPYRRCIERGEWVKPEDKGR